MHRLLLLALFLVNPSFSISQVVPSGLSTEIQAFNEKLESATKGMNNEETMALWADDGFEMQCHAISGSGNWASEWCEEHQIVLLPGGKPPFDGRGKMLLVLAKQADGNWRIEREMWTQE
jgi:hypothetical protein